MQTAQLPGYPSAASSDTANLLLGYIAAFSDIDKSDAEFKHCIDHFKKSFCYLVNYSFHD